MCVRMCACMYILVCMYVCILWVGGCIYECICVCVESLETVRVRHRKQTMINGRAVRLAMALGTLIITDLPPVLHKYIAENLSQGPFSARVLIQFHRYTLP